ncbi:MAG: MurR/RpiR family transcriptional regulator [Alicyclobacillus macrosporangiidus]|uniref:MurR/RpiR family transcriptional regulator n=1 Tax=Alicyclobacillus macrosporangiidus TaxID=392015 RepID=UPI0026F0E5F4|nr:MurR/RpiR family transcriptional regulator [Alicyclobacillus macrosporangiidus]MCL6598900.1 MurR/RpiR family transcriptional regulator [Alicyclobacillus macrosporangiidus]
MKKIFNNDLLILILDIFFGYVENPFHWRWLRGMRKAQESILQHIARIYPTLKGVSKEVARLIRERPEEVVRSNVTELAKSTQTSEAAVVRFAKRLGFKGFRDLQIQLAFELGNSLDRIEEEIDIRDDLRVVVDKSYFANVNALTESRDALDFEAFKTAVDLINRARMVYIFAQGANYSTACDLSYNLSKLGVINTVYSDTYMQAVTAAITEKNDVVVGISHTGANRDVIEAMSFARQNGATAIALTTRPHSPITQIASVSLSTANKEIVFQGEPLTSRISLMYLVDLLFLGVALVRGRPSVDTLRRVQDALSTKRVKPKDSMKTKSP